MARKRPDGQWWNCEWLADMYVGRGLTFDQLGVICGCSGSTVRYAAVKCGITPRHPGCRRRVYMKRDWLRARQHLSTSQIACEAGVTAYVIRYWIKKHGLRDPRSDPPTAEMLCHLYWGEGKSTIEVGRELGIHPGHVYEIMAGYDIPFRDDHPDADETYRDYDWLYERYVVRGMTGREIADEANTVLRTIYRWLERHGIDRRTAHERSTRNAPKDPGKPYAFADEPVLRQKLRDTEDSLRVVQFHAAKLMPGWSDLLESLKDCQSLATVIEIDVALNEMQFFQDSIQSATYREDGHRIRTEAS